MYLHLLIHSQLNRQRQAELARLRLRRDPESRSLPGKKTAAAVGALLAATIAALALTSGALAATAKKQPHGGTAAKGASWKVVQDASGKITIRVGGRTVYVYYPAPAQPQISSNTGANDDCVNYQVNCTEEQNCQLWGVNCDRISTTTNATPSAGEDTSATDPAPAPADTTAANPTADAAAAGDNDLLYQYAILVNLS